MVLTLINSEPYVRPVSYHYLTCKDPAQTHLPYCPGDSYVVPSWVVDYNENRKEENGSRISLPTSAKSPQGVASSADTVDDGNPA